ncbi:LAFA_0D13938g1_1 [Lachancea sp. 'fantastica']|nr:LAFA_0D13938g1_1 [Lachancea sp. 'fantastica']
MSDEDKQEPKKFYLERAGKRAEVNIEHLRKPHTFEPKKRPVGEKSCPLTLGGDHRPTADPKTKDLSKEEK